MESDYEMVFGEIAPNYVELVSANQQPTESWLQTATRIMSSLTATYQQKQLLDIQIDRARQGLPPMDMSGYTGLGVNVGVSEGTRQTALIVVAVLAGTYLLPKLLGR